MYPIEFQFFLQNLCQVKKDILFINCISFEERSLKGSIDLSNILKDSIYWFFFEIIDNGSRYEKKCTEIQSKHSMKLINHLGLNKDIPKFNLFDQKPEENLIKCIKQILLSLNSISTIIIDISCIPKTIYFPFLFWLINNFNEKKDILILYTKPGDYENINLEEEIRDTKTLLGIYKKSDYIIWIPCLGFIPEYTESNWEYIKRFSKDNPNIKFQIIPFLGFPAFRPDYYDKSLLIHAKYFDQKLDFYNELLSHRRFAKADDPYDIYYKIQEIYNNYSNKNIILSPIGPKPMAIGMALASIRFNLPVVSTQAKSYNPNYSIGMGNTVVFWISRNGKYTF